MDKIEMQNGLRPAEKMGMVSLSYLVEELNRANQVFAMNAEVMMRITDNLNPAPEVLSTQNYIEEEPIGLLPRLHREIIQYRRLLEIMAHQIDILNTQINS